MRESLAERVQLLRADEQMSRPAVELLFDNAFQEKCSRGYWASHGENPAKPNLLRAQLDLFKVG